MKKMTLIMIAFSLALLIALSACQQLPSANDPTQITSAPTETQPTDAVQTVDPRIAEMEKLLEYKGDFDLYHFALLSEYTAPEDVNLSVLFAYGFADESKQPTEQEIDLMGTWIVEDRADLRRLPVIKMDEALIDVFGFTLAQTNKVGIDKLWYLEETGCYYGYIYSGGHADISVERVEDRIDGTICVYYLRNKNDKMVLKLKPAGDSYQIISNNYEDPLVVNMQSLLEWPGENSFYNYALMSEFADPADVDLFQLFQSGFQDESDDPTELELELLEGKLGEHWKEMDLARLPVKKMDAVLTELFGITLAETNKVGLDNLVYLEETDCYYTANTGVYYADVTAIYAETDYDGVIMVQYDCYLGNRMVKLMLVDGEYRILSNAEIENLYNKPGVTNVVKDYFQQREVYLLETSAEMSNINPGVLVDEAAHLAAIHSAGIEWLDSKIVDIEVKGCWDSHAEAIVTEEISYRLDGIVYKETVLHTLQLGLLDDGTILVVCDGYKEKASEFTSCSYVPPELME